MHLCLCKIVLAEAFATYKDKKVCYCKSRNASKKEQQIESCVCVCVLRDDFQSVISQLQWCFWVLLHSWRPHLMSNDSVTRLVRYQISVLSNITHFKVLGKAGYNLVILSDNVYLLDLRIPACTCMCRQTLAHTSTESVSKLSIIASGIPVLFGWLQVDGWVSLEQLC